jgi:hypothetical protein
MCTGDAQQLLDRRTMPGRSMSSKVVLSAAYLAMSSQQDLAVTAVTTGGVHNQVKVSQKVDAQDGELHIPKQKTPGEGGATAGDVLTTENDEARV